MRQSRWIVPVITAAAFAAHPTVAMAQDGAFLTAGRVLAGTSTGASWHLTVERDLAGPLGVDGSFLILPGDPAFPGRLYGAGADLTLFSRETNVPTLFVGIAGGIGAGGQSRLWAGSSFGLRMPIIVLGPVRLMAEGRWRSLTINGRNGLEVGVALGFRTHRRPAVTQPEAAGLWVPPPTADILRARGIPDAKARLLSNVVGTALEEMGQPYVWGGTGNGAGGFDCSGLIEYTYSRQGIRIPRTAAGQAGAGVAIRRDRDDLLPGDILVFSDHGDQPTHVGLYVGDGRFIHSASRGVLLSRLADDDPEGHYWLHRWIGVRRIVE
ncbi:MAG: C40 family peptidase [Gemmatimonadales bacterium]